MVKIAAAQMRVSEDMETNYRRSLEFIKEAAEAGAAMVCFPEGQLTHYVPQYKGLKTEDIAIEPDHPYIQGFCDACRENGIIASVAVNLQIDGNVYPSMILISEEGEILGITKKNHIVYAPHFYEKDYFTPGDEGFPVFADIDRVPEDPVRHEEGRDNQHDHADENQEDSCAKRQVAPFHAGSSTSNLYPIRHTVAMVQLYLSESFSRRRFT